LRTEAGFACAGAPLLLVVVLAPGAAAALGPVLEVLVVTAGAAAPPFNNVLTRARLLARDGV
jgi:hypothetical protein